MGIPHLFHILGQFVKSHNPGAFCHDWYEKYNRPPKIGIDGSALIHPLLRRHKHELLLSGAKDGSNINNCKRFYDDMKSTLVDMQSWARGKVVLKLVCDGKRISLKLANLERERLREAALDRLPSQKFDSESEMHELVDDNLVDFSATSAKDEERDTSLAIGSWGPAARCVLKNICAELNISFTISIYIYILYY